MLIYLMKVIRYKQGEVGGRKNNHPAATRVVN